MEHINSAREPILLNQATHSLKEKESTEEADERGNRDASWQIVAC
jgi:hypothetical protein